MCQGVLKSVWLTLLKFIARKAELQRTHRRSFTVKVQFTISIQK
jgi:hypothetical protein